MSDVIRTDLAKVEVQGRFPGNLQFDIGILRPKLTCHPVGLFPQSGNQCLDRLAARVQADEDQGPAIIPSEQRIGPIQTRYGTRHSGDGPQGTGQKAQCIRGFCRIGVGNTADHQNEAVGVGRLETLRQFPVNFFGFRALDVNGGLEATFDFVGKGEQRKRHNKPGHCQPESAASGTMSSFQIRHYHLGSTSFPGLSEGNETTSVIAHIFT